LAILYALNWISIQPGDMLLQDADDDFLRDATRLGNYGVWMQAERESRLNCRLWVVLCNNVMNPG
jgi:hypothetical protein